MRREAVHASPTFFPAEFEGTLTRRVQVGWIVGSKSITVGIASPEAYLATLRLAGLKTQTRPALPDHITALPGSTISPIHSYPLSSLVPSCVHLVAARARTSSIAA